MPPVTIYLPPDLEKRLRKEARKARKSLSAYIADLARGQASGAWPKGYERLYGSWEGEFSIPEDPPPGDVDTM